MSVEQFYHHAKVIKISTLYVPGLRLLSLYGSSLIPEYISVFILFHYTFTKNFQATTVAIRADGYCVTYSVGIITEDTEQKETLIKSTAACI